MGGKWASCRLVFSEVVTIQKRGKSMAMEPIPKTRCTDRRLKARDDLELITIE